ncbi:endonuclease/exonuclease/phosphatase family protein [Halorarius litoreus]|uniref:endonuclease/exonuclease/phosphatase family protein n=1 Tax=Halorarius litoreus TaxID=2962676 RepID=UPI0020CDFC4F|nr:endonuclease/exonuclease/phosphatase family protein [Halorarius litoreus]
MSSTAGVRSAASREPLVLLRASLAVALLLVTLTYAVTRVFVLNFSTAGPNATALLALLLVTGWTLLVPFSSRLTSGAREQLLVAVAAGGVAFSLLGGPVVALVGASLTGLALTPVLATDAARLDARVGIAFALGLLLVLALRGLTGAVSAYATLVGGGVLVAFLLALGGATVALGDGTQRNTVPTLAPLFVALFLAALWLGFPTVTARWVGHPYPWAVGLSAVGLLVGGGWVAYLGAPGRRGALAWGLFLVGAMARLLSVETVPVVGLPLATAALVVLASIGGTGSQRPRRAGLTVSGAQLLALVAVVGFVLAVNWAFIPGVGPLLRGLEPALVLALAALVGATAVLAVRGRPDPTEPTGLDGTRRALVGGVGAGLLALVGGYLRRPTSGATPDRLRVATYNVHQFFDSRGRYNLRAVADLFRGRGIGILGLQETEGARITSGNVFGVRWLAAALGYHYAPGPEASVGGYGVSLLSAWPIDEAEVVELPTDDTVTRPALRATVDHPDGPIPVVVAHLEVDGEVRIRQARRVLELVEDAEAAVVLGDFNATPDEAVVDTMTASFTDSWAAVGDGPGYTYSASRPYQRIDYVFVRGFEPTAATVFGSADESDHRGVSTSLDRA